MTHEAENFLDRLRRADEDTKKLWVIAGTAVATLVIIGVWLTWFNNLNVIADTTQTSGTAQISDHGFSFFETIKSGGAALYHGIVDGIRGIVMSQKEYIVTPKN